MHQRNALVYLTVAAPVCLALFWLRLPHAGEVFAVLAVGFPMAIIAVGACREGRLGPLLGPLATLTLILEASVIAMLCLRGDVMAAPWIGGLPLSAAVMIYLMFALPLPLVGLAYALTFDAFTLREDDLRALGLAAERPKDNAR